MTDYCDPDLVLITETKIDSSIFSSELLPKGYVGEFRRDRNLNGGGIMIVTKDCYTHHHLRVIKLVFSIFPHISLLYR